MNMPIYKRHIEPRLREALADTPVVLLQGPRQCGKTTLAQMVGETDGYAYFTFDDEATKNFVRILQNRCSKFVYRTAGKAELCYLLTDE